MQIKLNMKYFIVLILSLYLFSCDAQKSYSIEELSKTVTQENKFDYQDIKPFINSKSFEAFDYLYVFDSINENSKTFSLQLTHKKISASYIDKYFFALCVCDTDSIVINYKKRKFSSEIKKEFITKFERLVPYNLENKLPYLHASISCPAYQKTEFEAWENFEKNVNEIIDAYIQIRNNSANKHFEKDFFSLSFSEKLEIVNAKPISIFLTFNDNCNVIPPPPPPANAM